MKITLVLVQEHLRHAIVLPFLAAAALGCTAPAPLPDIGSVVTGKWGTAHVGLTLTDSGGAIEYDCAHGGFSGPLRPDRAGRFEILGTHVPERGGPVRVGEVPDSQPARYAGQVSGDRMTLRVMLREDTIGPFELRRGMEAQLFRCL